MKKALLFILLFFVLAICPSYAQKIRFVQLTDVHTRDTNIHNLEAFVQEINKRNDIDFVVFTGDNIDKANLKSLDVFLKTVKHIKQPVYITIGNHDTFKQEFDKVAYMKKVRKELGRYHSNKPNYVFKKNGFVFVVMDGVKEVIPGPAGYYKKEELDWLDTTLTKHKDDKIVILQHFPLLPYRVKDHQTYKRDDYLELLKKHNNVKAILSGHFHMNEEMYVDGVYNIVSEPFFRNSTYKIIEMDTDDDFIYTYLISK